jgi:hypothetical protein
LKGSQPSREGPETGQFSVWNREVLTITHCLPMIPFIWWIATSFPSCQRHLHCSPFLFHPFFSNNWNTQISSGFAHNEILEVQRFCDLALLNAESLYAQRFISPTRFQPFKIESSLNPEKRNPQRSNV